jgi:radical SAM protein with 4Fe4S-binding SPASM domain
MKLLRKLLRRSHYRPERVTVDATYACNLRCVHCSATCLARPDGEELRTGELRVLFEDLAECGAQTLTLTGGELLMRRDWLEVATSAARRFRLVLYSNATLFTEADARALAALRPYQVEVTVYGASERTYEAVTGVAGSFEAFRQGLRRLDEAGVRVAPKFLMLQENAHEWRQVWEDYAGYEGFRWDVQISPRLDGDAGPCEHRAAAEHLTALMAQAGIPAAAEPDRSAGALPCDLGRRGCVITAYGDVWPCGLLPTVMGNVRETGFRSIWAGEAFARVWKMTLGELGKCRECDALAYCRPCWGLNLLEGGDACQASAESCRIARLKMAAAGTAGRTQVPAAGPNCSPADAR